MKTMEAHKKDSSDEDEEEADLYEEGWIQWVCSLEGHEFFCEVDEDFIRDNFNLYGLREKFAQYDEAIETILSTEIPTEDDLANESYLELYQMSVDLYGLIHARFIVTPRGLSIMKEKFISGRFGTCPRVMCERQHVLPVGLAEVLHTSRVKIFCPKCKDVFIPKNKYADIDGAYFGCSFPHLFMLTYPDLNPVKPTPEYIPKIYGFKIYKRKGSKYRKV
ncbi:unnamed protein product [Blepharisma stoltei]|uniref:Casein kinase II subunit beta n=1 Tax=Blepharisma stoltei TaxID=1481888 RepID=A0AAU9JV59_9CILI|nr:unnamed protein product [Blepharisma stoltei]